MYIVQLLYIVVRVIKVFFYWIHF